jgi:hypothetical protein
MKKNLKSIFIGFIFIFVFNNTFAKRLPAPQVPIIHCHGINYEATFSNGGMVKAYSAKTKNLLWEKQIYKIKYQPDLEKDIQDIYIKTMKIKNKNLIIKDEKGRSYLLNLKTRNVKHIP